MRPQMFELRIHSGAGVMSKHIGSLQVGDTLECKGSVSKLPMKDIAAKTAVGMVRRGASALLESHLSELSALRESVFVPFCEKTRTSSALSG